MFEYTSGLRAAQDNGEGDETAGPKRGTPRFSAIGTLVQPVKYTFSA